MTPHAGGPVGRTKSLKRPRLATDVLNMLAVSRRALRSAHTRVTGPTADRGDIVMGWLTRLTVLFAVVGVGLFDAISVGTTTASVADQGQYAAQAASETWDGTHNVQAAYNAAVKAATEQDAQNEVSTKGFVIDPDGTVHLRISREARTLILYRWGRTAKWAKITRTAKARSLDT